MSSIESLQALYGLLAAQVPSVISVANDGAGGFKVKLPDDATDEDKATVQSIVTSFMATPDPDWPTFRGQIILDPAVQRVLSSNALIGPLLMQTLWEASKDPALFGEVVQWWNVLASSVSPSLDADEIAAINTIATDNNIRLSLAADGSMEIG